MNARMLPLLGFGLLFALLGFGLWYVRDHDITEIPSPLLGKTAPTYALPQLDAPDTPFGTAQLMGKPYLLHVFASWCFVCRAENPILMTKGKRLGVPLIGFDYKDDPSDARLWLQQFGNPYDVVISDLDGTVGIDFGVYGAPESFLIDGKGVIRHKHVGAMTDEVIESELIPLLGRIRQEPTK